MLLGRYKFQPLPEASCIPALSASRPQQVTFLTLKSTSHPQKNLPRISLKLHNKKVYQTNAKTPLKSLMSCERVARTKANPTTGESVGIGQQTAPSYVELVESQNLTPQMWPRNDGGYLFIPTLLANTQGWEKLTTPGHIKGITYGDIWGQKAPNFFISCYV